MLALDLFGRIAAGGLFMLNLVAVIAYCSELSKSGINLHLYWGDTAGRFVDHESQRMVIGYVTGKKAEMNRVAPLRSNNNV